ncbi:hypothetical protein [Enterocloster asparagiformis]|uniref:hypothetical protein n=1 Tax=Enterocloster asparagiformis TaxID=333367 RepID=UPI0004651FFA|nr:hypothetical protein [Enterocloster asparagiformis]
MSNCYQFTRWIKYGGIAAGAAAGALFCLMGGTGHLVVRILYGVMIFAVVGVISFTVAQYGSLNRMNRDLALLNRDLDPEAFLREFEPAARRCRRDTIQGIMAWVYVSSAYGARGEWQTAMKLLDSLKPELLKNRGQAARGLVLNQKFQCQYALSDLKGANETLEQLRGLAVQMQRRQPAVAKNLSYNARLFGEYLNFAGGDLVDTEYLEEEIRLSASPLHRQQVCMVLADVYRSRRQFGDERRLLTEVCAHGGGLKLRETARQRLDQMEREDRAGEE